MAPWFPSSALARALLSAYFSMACLLAAGERRCAGVWELSLLQLVRHSPEQFLMVRKGKRGEAFNCRGEGRDGYSPENEVDIQVVGQF